MKKMILSALVCAAVSLSAVAQVQDSTQISRRLHKGECQKLEHGVRPQARKVEGKAVRRERPSIEQRVQGKTLFLSKKLQLNEQQTEQLNAILIKKAKSMKQSRTEFKIKEEALDMERREAFKSLKEDTNTEVQAVLTEEQYAQYVALETEHHNHKGEGRAPQGRPHGRKGYGKRVERTQGGEHGKFHHGNRPPRPEGRPHAERPKPVNEAE